MKYLKNLILENSKVDKLQMIRDEINNSIGIVDIIEDFNAILIDFNDDSKKFEFNIKNIELNFYYKRFKEKEKDFCNLTWSALADYKLSFLRYLVDEKFNFMTDGEISIYTNTIKIDSSDTAEIEYLKTVEKRLKLMGFNFNYIFSTVFKNSETTRRIDSTENLISFINSNKKEEISYYTIFLHIKYELNYTGKGINLSSLPDEIKSDIDKFINKWSLSVSATKDLIKIINKHYKQ